MHASPHAELQEYKDPVSETKKVTEFLDGISFPKLDMVKAYMMGMDALNEELCPCQNYIKVITLM